VVAPVFGSVYPLFASHRFREKKNKKITGQDKYSTHVSTARKYFSSPISGTSNHRAVAEVMHEWSQGVAYELIKGRLCFAAHPSDEHTIKVIKRFPHRFYFSSPLPGGRPALGHLFRLGLGMRPFIVSCCTAASDRTRNPQDDAI
jgi:hypothetical protein